VGRIEEKEGVFEIPDLVRLEGLHFRSDPETSPSDLQCPDLYFWRVSEHLEASFSRVELSRASVIQWGTPFSGGFQIYRD
jgi:hypothetical protein